MGRIEPPGVSEQGLDAPGPVRDPFQRVHPEVGELESTAHEPPRGGSNDNLAGLSQYATHSPQIPLIADYSLNVSNEATAALMMSGGVRRITPSYDLSWRQLAELFKHFPANAFEQVIHQHMPMFHMEHCVFAHTLSTGKDYRDCGRPCERLRWI